MTGAMYAAIAGLKTHMSKMNVIGNNIANVNTNGYKSQRTIFKDAMYTMYSSGSDGTTTTAGRNPSQIGYGSQISSIDLNMSTGTYAPGISTDCMIYGDGFFMVGDKNVNIDPLDPDSTKKLSLTRVGDFSFKADGYLSDGNGNAVYGFLVTGKDEEGKIEVSDQLVAIRLPRMEKVYTSKTDPNNQITQDAYANLGEAAKADYTMEYKIQYPVAESTDGKAIPLEDYTGKVDANAADPDAEPVELPFAQLDSVTINAETGAITGTSKDTDELVTIGYLAIGNVTNPNGVSHTEGFYYTAGDGAGDLQVSMLGGVAEELGITSVNGSLFAAAAEAAGLDDTTQSQKMLVGSAGGTNLMTGGLEGSNVDLASEISELITTQRGYQANTRIITVTDSMLEELVNMKR